MPEAKLVRAYHEGDDDRAVLEGLKYAGLLPETLEIATRDKKRLGKEGVVYELSSFVRPANGAAGRAIALVDIDDKQTGQLAEWFRQELRKTLPSGSTDLDVGFEQSDRRPNVSLISLSSGDKKGAVALVAIGLADDQEFRQTFGIDEFAIDDHIFRLSRDPGVFASIPDFAEVTPDVAMNKLDEMVSLLRSNNLSIRRSKRFLHLLRAIVGFRASSAAFIDRLLTKAMDAVGTDRVRALLAPLVDDLEEAVKIVSL